MDIKYNTASNDDQLKAILQLQQDNLPKNISPHEKEKEGFVTVEHDFNLLKKLNSPYPHIIALEGNEVIGYALVMLPEFRNDIPILVPMFNQIDISLRKKNMNIKYFAMGQVCIAKSHRKLGLFYGLYDKMKNELSPYFDAVITEVDPLNQRSLHAHLKQGFEILESYRDEKGRPWELIIWEW